MYNKNSLIKIINLNKIFKEGCKYITVLENINLEFYNNSSYAIKGISGSGKSTLLYLLAGLDKPTSGKIYFNSKDIDKFTESEKQKYLNQDIGFIFQEPYLLKELTVIENVMLKGLINKLDFKIAKKQAQDLLNLVNLTTKINCYPALLSGGEQQRVAIARALFNKPKFLLADEPTAHLDPKNRETIINLLLDLQKKYSLGLIIATHDSYISERLQNQINFNINT